MECGLRDMTAGDLDEVTAVDVRAFAGQTGATAPRRRDLLTAYLTAGGGLVAETDRAVSGYLFWHRWGGYAWLGPVGVDPPHQGRGVGRRLVEAALDRLGTAGVRVTGLETWPGEGKNLTFWARLGFGWDGFCLLLQRNVPPEGAPIPRVPVEDPAVVRAPAAALWPGLDPSPWVGAMLRLGVGELFAGRDGAVLCQRGGSREGTGGLGLIRLLVSGPGSRPSRAFELVQTACAYFRAVGVTEVVLPLPGSERHRLPEFLAQGWRVAAAAMRGHYPASPPPFRGTALFSLMG